MLSLLYLKMAIGICIAFTKSRKSEASNGCRSMPAFFDNKDARILIGRYGKPALSNAFEGIPSSKRVPIGTSPLLYFSSSSLKRLFTASTSFSAAFFELPNSALWNLTLCSWAASLTTCLRSSALPFS